MERLGRSPTLATREQLTQLDKAAQWGVLTVAWDEKKGARSSVVLQRDKQTGYEERVDVQVGHGVTLIDYYDGEDSVHAMLTHDDYSARGSALIAVGKYEDMNVPADRNAVSSDAAKLLIEKVAEASPLIQLFNS